MVPDDIRIPDSLKIAAQKGIEITFGTAQLREAHPNSAQIYLTGETGRTLEVIGESIGGGRINIAQIDGIQTNFTGEYPTLVVHNLDQPGHVTEVTAMLAKARINIATMQLYRSARGGDAVMVLECDQEVPEQIVHRLEQLSGIKKSNVSEPCIKSCIQKTMRNGEYMIYHFNQDLLNLAKEYQIPLWEVVCRADMEERQVTKEQSFETMHRDV